MQINRRRIGHDQPCYIIAEMSCNHMQDKERALRLVEAAKEAGADAVKIQTYKPAEVSAGDEQKEKLYEKLHMPWEWIPEIMSLAHEIGITCFSTPASTLAVQWLEECNVPAYKVASCDHANYDLLIEIEHTGKPVIMSFGMAEKRSIWNALSFMGPDTAILKCTSAYPTPHDEVNLKTMCNMIRLFDVPVGYSDHTVGYEICLAAAALGACIIEKHFYLRGTKPPDMPFSIDEVQFKSMVSQIRNVEQALGHVKYGHTESEKAVLWLKEFKSVSK